VSAAFLLRAPIAGWASDLAEVADPVFADAMLGDGVAIDPIGAVLQAPCAGVVGTVHAARHAVTLRAEGGLELLLHVGLDTVGLDGEGLEPLVKEGDRVAAGDALIALDLDRLAGGARSLVTPLVITDLGDWSIGRRYLDRLLSAGDPLLELAPAGGRAAARAPTSGPEMRREVVVGLEHGLHARPAARLGAALKALAVEVEVRAGARSANARSPVALMTLGVAHGDTVALVATGPDADAALAALAALMSGADPDGTSTTAAAAVPVVAGRAGGIRGLGAAPGLAIGPAFRWTPGDIAVVEAGRGVVAEGQALAAALAAVRRAIDADAAAEAEPTRAAVLAAHAALVEDPGLAADAEREVAAGRSAAFAWKAAASAYADILAGLPDTRMAERADDLRDLSRRVLETLTGEAAPAPDPPAGAILVAEELLPSQLLAIPPGRLAGVALARGGPTSHVAIIAAAMGLPTLVGAGPALAAVSSGATLVLDADAGALVVAPKPRALQAARRRLAAQQAERAAAAATALAPAALADGAPIAVLANLGGSAGEAALAVAAGAEGCGLLRTEFLFLDRDTAPDEAEQLAAYQAVADALDSRPLVVRLLDIGADKPARFAAQPAEENPALGLRGVRLALRRPALLRTQLRAILQVRGPLSIMVPMVADLGELRAVRAALAEAAAELGRDTTPDLGVMVETPAAAMIADQLAAGATFISIGANDLAQYALAIDRGHPELAGAIDGLAPPVLRLIAAACEGAARHGRPVSVCGALASDPAAIPILIGLGVTRLSMPAPAIAPAKALLRRLTLEACRALAARALAAASAAEVRALTRSAG